MLRECYADIEAKIQEHFDAGGIGVIVIGNPGDDLSFIVFLPCACLMCCFVCIKEMLQLLWGPKGMPRHAEKW